MKAGWERWGVKTKKSLGLHTASLPSTSLSREAIAAIAEHARTTRPRVTEDSQDFSWGEIMRRFSICSLQAHKAAQNDAWVHSPSTRPGLTRAANSTDAFRGSNRRSSRIISRDRRATQSRIRRGSVVHPSANESRVLGSARPGAITYSGPPPSSYSWTMPDAIVVGPSCWVYLDRRAFNTAIEPRGSPAICSVASTWFRSTHRRMRTDSLGFPDPRRRPRGRVHARIDESRTSHRRPSAIVDHTLYGHSFDFSKSFRLSFRTISL